MSITRSHSLPHLESSRQDSTVSSTAISVSGSFSGLDTLDSSSTSNSVVKHTRRVKRKSYEVTLGTDVKQLLTLKQHYYPEGHWGWFVVFIAVVAQCIDHGLHMAFGVFLIELCRLYGSDFATGWLGSMSTAVALLISPLTIAVCKRKSTRLTAVIGGLVTALGCLFTSFASQFHQLFFSYGTVVGIGVGMTRDCSTLMVAQYFKRKREFVEIFIVAGSGLGIVVMSTFIKSAIESIGWRLGLQAVTVAVFVTFILGTCYRSASLYHPQRRAILHLKNQKRKIKDKNKQYDRPPFFDFSTLKSRTVQILLTSTAITAFGINTPIYYLAHQIQKDGISDKILILQAYLGAAWIFGCIVFGLLVVVRNNVECRIARQYLCQTAIFMCGFSILGLTTVQGNYNAYVMFVWVYGFFCGGYHYTLKMFLFEKVRARNFARAWGFVQFFQAVPIAIGVPITGYINLNNSGLVGYYFSAGCVLFGSSVLFLVDLHKRNVSRNKHKHTRENGSKQLCVSESCPQKRKLSFTQEPDNEPGILHDGALVLGTELLIPHVSDALMDAVNGMDKPELTCISEEGIADMDLPDNILDEFEYAGDCITSCNKVENLLVLSEFENNLAIPSLNTKKSFKKSKKNGLSNQTILEASHESHEDHHHNHKPNKYQNHCPMHNNLHPNNHVPSQKDKDYAKNNSKWHQSASFLSNRIAVIEEAPV